ncbi:nuclear transport factor 2 family protein [Streptomyces gobiensis]|uniref:nuclear transport factor 2 family protein n=1 Tax=Streptomyces gobiensis TaxID=2875706 RepID=UPI001E2ABDFF|nr:nuclear transport factor 2 family protein [Streptomyces gobiensis]UGY94293.1 nuclear transport factor 2 family protein [Streptomyces gobiensis]
MPFDAETITGFTPTDEDRHSLAEWFRQYDAHSTSADIQHMADMAVFPLNLVTDDSAGNGWSGQWDQGQFTTTMTQVMGDGGEDVQFESVRTPFFLSGSLAIVITRATMTMDGGTQEMRYADILVKSDGKWAFQTMIQAGWGDMLKGELQH